MAAWKSIMLALTFLLLAAMETHSRPSFQPQNFPFWNVSLSFEARVEDLVGRLTIDEIIAQMSHGGASNNGPAPAIPRLGIKPYQWGTECLSGDVGAGPATSFPMSIGLAATFSNDTVFKVIRAVSDEVRAKSNNYSANGNYNFHTGLSCWSPVLNILRDPRWGRNQETYGEDPWLSGFLGSAYVRALQGDDPRYLEANAGCKHFDVHGGPENIPVSRFSFDAKVSEIDLRMTFLPQFKTCIEAGSASVMCSYNSINGVPACANSYILNQILRTEWNFTGYVVSDQGAIENIIDWHHYRNTKADAATAAINGGTDLEDANYEDNVFAHAGEALKQGTISENTFRESAKRLFMVRMRLGEFDPPEMNPYRKLDVKDYIQSPQHIEIATEAAVKSIVLLKNDAEKGLPIIKPLNTICVVGPFIDSPGLLFGDYSPDIMTDYVVTPLKAITDGKSKIANTVKNANGCSDEKCTDYQKDDVVEACKGADAAVVCLGTGVGNEREGQDRDNIQLPGHQLDLLKDVVDAVDSTYLVLFSGSPLDVSWADSNPKVTAILESFFPGQTGGTALLKILTGAASPAARLPMTWPAVLSQYPEITDYTMVNRTYRYFTNSSSPLYPFGYGLSYSTFTYSDLKISPATFTMTVDDSVTVSVLVKNDGQYDNAEEVVQFYIQWSAVSVAPHLQMVGAERVSIGAGQAMTVSTVIKADQLKLHTGSGWTTPLTKITVYAGGQQPFQNKKATSNVLSGTFSIVSKMTNDIL